jgi:Txe/YoeB family toxin of toxin-antitoxin system
VFHTQKIFGIKYKIILSNQALKDMKKIKIANLKNKVENILDLISNNPFQNPPYYEKLVGYVSRYSRRINKQHRLIYTIYDDTIKINSMWSHYE